MIEFLGHFHPLLVHLPIGILLVGLLLQWLSTKERYVAFKHPLPLIFLVGSITAIVSCITGYFLSITDSYDRSLVNWHMWMAIGVVVVSLILYSKERNPTVEVPKKLLSVGLFVLIMLTGHFGGSLTHGSDYLTKPFFKFFSSDSVANIAIKPLPNVQEAVAYADVVQPILQTKCYSCHNINKQKGKLRMDDITLLMKGGKNGAIIDLNDPDSSEMLKRMLLPVDNEHHMPPKEKPQPTEAQIALIHWWLSNKADFKRKVKDLNQPEKIKPVLLALQKQSDTKKVNVDIPIEAVEKADDKVIGQLQQKGFVVLPLAQNTNYIQATLEDGGVADKASLDLLSKLKKQLISLKVTNTNFKEDALPYIGNLRNLRKLNLSNTNVDDKALGQLQALQNLQHLNLVGTKVTANGIFQLQKLKQLKSLYLYQTSVTRGDFNKLKAAFPKTEIDSGNYSVPLLTSDTTLVKAAKTK
jgi:uncharacterized membrane protein/mono/diheme cytochrome c family protein